MKVMEPVNLSFQNKKFLIIFFKFKGLSVLKKNFMFLKMVWFNLLIDDLSIWLLSDVELTEVIKYEDMLLAVDPALIAVHQKTK
jgi:hypothetical protein